MRHLKAHRKLGRDSSHRKAMLRNLATSLINHEKILTTVTRAKEVRSVVDKLITYGKKGGLHRRRLAASVCFNQEAVSKIFDSLAGRFKDRPGGYTRIIRKGPRAGDGAMMAYIEFVDRPEETLEAAQPEDKKVAKAKK